MGLSDAKVGRLRFNHKVRHRDLPDHITAILGFHWATTDANEEIQFAELQHFIGRSSEAVHNAGAELMPVLLDYVD